MSLESLVNVQTALKALIKAEKDVAKKGEAFRSLNFENSTTTRRAGASDRLTDACFDRDRARDTLHAALVDSGLADAKPVDSYQPREIRQNAGFGHSINFIYHPAVPKCIQEKCKSIKGERP